MKINIHKILGHSENTLLYKYSEKAIDTYVEPPRKNVAKGNNIGFSCKKNAASIFMGLTNFQYKILSERSGLSYLSIRAWHMKPDFKKAMKKHCHNFVEFVGQEIKKHFKEEDIKDKYLYSDCILEKTHELSVTLTSPLSQEAMNSEIDRHLNILSKGVMSHKERNALYNLLIMVKTYGEVKLNND